MPTPLQPGDHHWVTLVAEYWDSEADYKAGKPSVLTVDPQFGHRFIAGHQHVGDEIARVLDGHYAGGRRGAILDPARAKEHSVDDVLGMLNHPHVKAIEVTA